MYDILFESQKLQNVLTGWNFEIIFQQYEGHFKSSAHCACVASRMMQSFLFSRQLWARLQ